MNYKRLFLPPYFVLFFRIKPCLLEGDTGKRQAQGLLECWLDSVPVVAVVIAHDDDTTAEVQAVRGVVVPRVSTRRPIAAVVTNDEQLTRSVLTQGGQVKVVTCVGSGRKARVGDTTTAVDVTLVCCTHVV